MSHSYCCTDINECMLNGGLGPCNQICSNNPGSFSCSCATGYTLSGFVCNGVFRIPCACVLPMVVTCKARLKVRVQKSDIIIQVKINYIC